MRIVGNTGQLTDLGESVMRIVGNTGQLTDSGDSVMRIGGNTGQLTDSGKSVMRIGGNTGQLTDSGESVMRIGGNTGQLLLTNIERSPSGVYSSLPVNWLSIVPSRGDLLGTNGSTGAPAKHCATLLQ